MACAPFRRHSNFLQLLSYPDAGTDTDQTDSRNADNQKRGEAVSGLRNIIRNLDDIERHLVRWFLRRGDERNIIRLLIPDRSCLLMDDVLLELDPDKRTKLTAMLPEYEQLFCTFLPGEPYQRYMHDTTKVYKIEKGEWHE